MDTRSRATRSESRGLNSPWASAVKSHEAEKIEPTVRLEKMTDSTLKVLFFQIFTAISLVSCSSTGDNLGSPDRTAADLDFRGSDCILIRSVRDYTPLDSQHLLIRGPGRRGYFVTLSRPTFEMRGTMGLGFDSRDEQLCPFGGDSIVFGGMVNERVPVQFISRLTAEQEEYLMIRYGQKEPVESETPEEPAEIKGAEVEELG